MMRRRRPLARAAIVGGAAYHVGKRNAQNQQYAAEQDARISDLEAQQAGAQQPQYAPPPPAAAPPPPPAAGGMSPDTIQQLTQLGQLHEQGVLTDEEFAAQKAKILGTS
jgi:hypothetical protein